MGLLDSLLQEAWLPPQAVKKIKFLTKSNMSEYVDDENRLECWGGQDTWEYKFEPESRHSNGLKDEGRKKTVTFAGSPMVASPSADSLGSALSSNSGGGGGGGPQGVDLLHLSPAQEVIFSTSPLGDLTGKVSLTNTSGKPLGYKIKTTSPEKYRVRPSTGSISPGQTVTVEIHVSGQKEVAIRREPQRQGLGLAKSMPVLNLQLLLRTPSDRWQTLARKLLSWWKDNSNWLAR